MEDGVKTEVKELEKEAKIIWKQPGRAEVFLVLVYLFAWYLFNDMFNLISIEGLATKGNFFNGIIIPVWIPFFVSFIAMIVVMVTFIVRSTFDTATHRGINIAIGIWIVFGTVLMIIAMVLMLQGLGPMYEVEWLLGLSRNGIYHLGVFLFQIPGIIYFALFG